MKRKYLRKGGGYLFLCTVMILGALLLIGCGSDGDTGPPGPPGPPGQDAVAPGSGEMPATSETCVICHGTDKIADIAVFHPDPTGEDVTISEITLTNAAGFAVVSFNATTPPTTEGGDPVPVTGLTLDDVLFYMADLVPAGTATQWGTWDTDYFERWAYERSGVDTRNNDTPYPHGDLIDNGDGSYTYNFVTGFGSDEALAEAPDYNALHTQRLLIRVSGLDDPDTGAAITNNTVGFLDFVVPADGGAPADPLLSQRAFVTADACKQCHGPQFAQAAHADGYLDTRACVICHSPLGHYGTAMQEDDAYASVFFHKIHGAIDIPVWTEDGRINGLGYSAVTYPQDIKDCVVCHNNDSGQDLGDPALIDNWKTHPTAEICGSCHTDVNFTTGENHVGGVQPNSNCTVCHQASGGITVVSAPVPAVHDTTAVGMDVPEFDVTIAIDPPANGTDYVAGEAPAVRVTLKDHATGLDVDPAIYTTKQDLAGHAGGGLRTASLYVYGPRAKSVPVLATNTVTDPNSTGTPTQGHSLFTGGNDPRVITSDAGFGYQLFAIPEDMKAGTYMVRFEGADYAGLSDTDYVTSSTALINIQVGDDVVEKKVAGDACTNCHGDTRMHLTGSHAHNVPFNTDYCLACHDQSGNHGVPIANRVHAVHDANPYGDIEVFYAGSPPEDRPWDEVTYPQDIDRCVTCHNSGYDEATNTYTGTYKTLPYMMPCAGCHVGNPDDPFEAGVYDHMIQNGGPYF